MCVCVETVRQSLADVKRQTEEVAVRPMDMDDFLDAINYFSKRLVAITQKTDDFLESFRQDITSFSIEDSKILLADLYDLKKSMAELYTTLRQSQYYVGMKTVVKNYHRTMEDFYELYDDLKTYNIDLSRNEKYAALLGELNSIA